MADNSKADGPVVIRPSHFGRRPTTGLISFVSIDSRREKITKFRGIFEQAAEEFAESLGWSVLFIIPKRILAFLPKTAMDVATVSGFAHGGLGHECDGPILRRGDFFDALLE